MKFPQTLSVRVAEAGMVTPAIRRFTLLPVGGESLPGFSAGSHVVVHMPDGARTHRNAYSLLSAPGGRSAYEIAVRRQERSRGGSVYMHERVNVGDVLQITPPSNLFPIDRLASKHIFIAGGIGITPFMSYIRDLVGQMSPYELHYAYRMPEHAAFRDDLARQLGERLHEYDAASGGRLAPRKLLADQPLGTHVYVCGPESLTGSVVEAARELGWSASHVHYERFAAPQPGRPFKVNCVRSEREIDVPGDVSLLEALETAGVDVPSMCRGGVCGQCATDLLEGEAEHRDSYLPVELRSRKIMPCVSRANCERLVLDI